MSLKHVLFATALAVVAPARSNAEPIETDPEVGAIYSPGGLTADAAAHRARAASPAVWHKLAELEEAAAGVAAAKLARVPTVTTKVSYTRLSDIARPSTAALGSAGLAFPVILDNYAATTTITVPLSDYVLRHPGTIGAAKLGAAAARTNVLATELGAATAARRAYYEWIRAKLQLVISKRQLAQVAANRWQIAQTVEAGRLPRADLLRLESQEAEVQQQVDQLRKLAALREEMLRLQIGARSDEPLGVGEDICASLLVAPAASLDDLTHLATTQRLDFKALALGIAANEQRRTAERANALPKLSAFAQSEYSNPNQRSFPQEEKFDWTWSAGLQLTYTLNDTLISRTTSRKLGAEKQALEADRAALAIDARLAVLAAQQSITNAQKAIDTTRAGLAAAEEGYRVRRALLAAERVTAVELVDAETDLTRARISALDARIDLRIAVAELDHALGNDR